MCMLMAPEPSGRVAGATGSRSPVGADRIFGPKVEPRAFVASEEVLTAARLPTPKANSLGS